MVFTYISHWKSRDDLYKGGVFAKHGGVEEVAIDRKEQFCVLSQIITLGQCPLVEAIPCRTASYG